MQTATFALDASTVTANVSAALAEDLGQKKQDWTAGLIDAQVRCKAWILAREAAVICGRPWVEETLKQIAPSVSLNWKVQEGQRCAENQIVVEFEGLARELLTAERTILNFMQLLSATATVTATYVDAISTAPGNRARIVDTRKTTPGLRPFEKYAVVCGGGHNHRYGLSDAVMMKDNHLAALAARGIDLAGAIRHVREQVGHTTHIEVEVDRLDQIPAVLAGGADTIMLDNFSLDDTRRGVELIDGKAIVEASGNMSLERVPAVAVTGVDVISVGALTHSVRSIDLGLDWN